MEKSRERKAQYLTLDFDFGESIEKGGPSPSHELETAHPAIARALRADANSSVFLAVSQRPYSLLTQARLSAALFVVRFYSHLPPPDNSDT